MLKWIARQCGAAIAQKKEKETELSIKQHTKAITRRPTSELYGVCEEDFVSAGYLVMCIYAWNKNVHKFRAARRIIQWHRATRLILQDSHGACGEEAVASTPWSIARKALASSSLTIRSSTEQLETQTRLVDSVFDPATRNSTAAPSAQPSSEPSSAPSAQPSSKPSSATRNAATGNPAQPSEELEEEHVIELIIQDRNELQMQIAGTENKFEFEQRTQDQSTECIAHNHKSQESLPELDRIIDEKFNRYESVPICCLAQC